jgi:hypothetical protein
MLLRLFRRRTEWKKAVIADARRLMESFNERAYFEARERVRGRCIDGGPAAAPLDCSQARDRKAAGNCHRPRRRGHARLKPWRPALRRRKTGEGLVMMDRQRD